MSVKGVQATIAEIRKFGKEAEQMINAETEAIAFQIEHDAKVNAPKNFGKLAQSISTKDGNDDKKEAIISKVITVNEYYAPYVEFGTGVKVSIPAELSDLAAQFKGPTGRSFEDGVRSIEEWLDKKGGDRKDAKWILIQILHNGLDAQPFLYPSFVKGRKDYQNNLKALLKRLKKKI